MKADKNTRLTVAGAIYYIEDKNIIASPLRTTSAGLTECRVYREVKKGACNLIDDLVFYGGNTYYLDSNEKTVFTEDLTVDDNWELLSDLSDFFHIEEKHNFDE